MNKKTIERIPSILDFLDTLNFTIRKSYSNKKFVPKQAINWFDLNTAGLIATMCELCADNSQPQFKISLANLSEAAHVSQQCTRTRIDRLVTFGLITTESEWSEVKNRRNVTTFRLHKHLAMAIGKSARTQMQTEASKYFTAVGLKRLTGDGELSDDESSAFNNLAQRAATEKSQKLRETTEWRDNDKHFVAGAAKCWQHIQAYRGYGSQMPNWFGDNLAPSAMQERRELTKLFQQYGGRVTALAWRVFVGGIPDMDEKTGRTKFDIHNPHIQFASVDKKPSQFAKHFNAILSDKNFMELATIDWPKTEPVLRGYFAGMMDVGPRSGADDSDLIGFYMGQKTPTISEVNT